MLSVAMGKNLLDRGRQSAIAVIRQSLIVNSIFLMTATAISSIGGFIFWLLAARLYPTELVGLASALVSAAVLVTSLASLGLGFGVVRYHASPSNDSIKAINACLSIAGLLSLLFGGIYLAGLSWWSPALLPLPGGYWMAAVFMCITTLANLVGLADYVFMAARRTGYVLGQNVVHSIVKVALVATATTFGVLGILFAVAAAYAVIALLVLLLFLPGIWAGYFPTPSFNWSPVRPLLKYALANHASALLWGLPGSVLPLVVINHFGPISTAHFFIVWAMAGLIWAVPLAVSNALFAEGSADGIKLGSHLRQALWLGVCLVVAPVAIALLMGDKFLLLFGTGYAQEGTLLLQVLSLGSFPLTLVYGYLGVLRVRRKLQELCFVTALVAIGGPGLALILVPSIGLLGVALGHVVALSAAAIVSAIRMRSVGLI